MSLTVPLVLSVAIWAAYAIIDSTIQKRKKK